jgi:acetamidase/formamidase
VVAQHQLYSSPETVHWGFFDASLPPVLRVDSGDRVTFHCVSGEPEDMPPDTSKVLPELRKIHLNCPRGPGPHILTGPVWVNGAEIGDCLEIRIVDCTLRQDWGWNLIMPGRGTLPEDFTEVRRLHIGLDRKAMVAELPWGGRLPLRPFFGVMGVAPQPCCGRVSSSPPAEHGGNLDNRELVAGTTLFLPVWNEGALFSVGDGHAVQGDGEVCLTAIETALSGTFELTVRKDLSISFPRAETPTHYITMGMALDLDDAAIQAVREMISLLRSLAGLSREDAYSFCSLALELCVTQLVDGNKGIHAMIAKNLISG